MRGAQPDDERLPIGGAIAGVAEDLGRHRSRADSQRVEKPTGVRRQRTQARVEHAGEGGRLGRLVRSYPGARVECQLLQHERAAACLLRHAPLVDFGESSVTRHEAVNQRARFVVVHWFQRECRPRAAARATRVVRRWVGDRAIEQGPQEGLGRHLLAPEAEERQHGRRRRRAEQLLEQHGAVGIGPLQIVDPDHEQTAVGQLAQQRTKRVERLMAEAQRIAGLGLFLPRDGGDGRDLKQHGKHAREPSDIGRKYARDFIGRHRREVTAAIVDHAVKGLVRDRFVLVAAAGEHDRLTVAGERREEMADQCALADADGP
jgi:hypothetical protein